VYTSAKQYVKVCNIKLVYRLIIVLKLAKGSKLALFYVLQIGEEEIIFLDLDQNADYPQNLTD